MKRKKKVEEIYTLTPKGAILLAIEENKDVLDALELCARRNGNNAIVFNSEGGEFIHVHLEDV